MNILDLVKRNKIEEIVPFIKKHPEQLNRSFSSVIQIKPCGDEKHLEVSMHVSPCGLAASLGNAAALTTLLSLGAVLNNHETDSKVMPIWHASLLTPQPKILKIVEEHLHSKIEDHLDLIYSYKGAALNIELTPVLFAAQHNNWQFIEDLLDKGITLNVNQGVGINNFSIYLLRSEIPKEKKLHLIDRIYANGEKFDLNKLDSSRYPLSVLWSMNEPRIFCDLIDRGSACDLNMKFTVNNKSSYKKDIFTPLSYLACDSFFEIIMEFLRRDYTLDFNVLTPDGITIFEHLVDQEPLNLVQLLIEKTFKIDIRENDQDKGDLILKVFDLFDQDKTNYHSQEKWHPIETFIRKADFKTLSLETFETLYMHPLVFINKLPQFIEHYEKYLNSLGILQGQINTTHLVFMIYICTILHDVSDKVLTHVKKYFGQKWAQMETWMNEHLKEIIPVTHLTPLSEGYSEQAKLAKIQFCTDLKASFNIDLLPNETQYYNLFIDLQLNYEAHQRAIRVDDSLTGALIDDRFIQTLSNPALNHSKHLFLKHAKALFAKGLSDYSILSKLSLSYIDGTSLISPLQLIISLGDSDFALQLFNALPDKTYCRHIHQEQQSKFKVSPFHLATHSSAESLLMAMFPYLRPEDLFDKPVNAYGKLVTPLNRLLDRTDLSVSCIQQFVNFIDGNHFTNYLRDCKEFFYTIFHVNNSYKHYSSILCLISKINDSNILRDKQDHEMVYRLPNLISKKLAEEVVLAFLNIANFNCELLFDSCKQSGVESAFVQIIRSGNKTLISKVVSLLRGVNNLKSLNISAKEGQKALFISLKYNEFKAAKLLTSYGSGYNENGLCALDLVSPIENLEFETAEAIAGSPAKLASWVSQVKPKNNMLIMSLLADYQNWIDYLFAIAAEKDLLYTNDRGDSFISAIIKTKNWMFLAQFLNKVLPSKILSLLTIEDQNEWIKLLISTNNPKLLDVLVALDFSYFKSFSSEVIECIFIKSISFEENKILTEKIAKINFHEGKKYLLFHYHSIKRFFLNKEFSEAKNKFDHAFKIFKTFTPYEDLFAKLEKEIKTAQEDELTLRASLIAAKTLSKPAAKTTAFVSVSTQETKPVRKPAAKQVDSNEAYKAFWVEKQKAEEGRLSKETTKSAKVSHKKEGEFYLEPGPFYSYKQWFEDIILEKNKSALRAKTQPAETSVKAISSASAAATPPKASASANLPKAHDFAPQIIPVTSDITADKMHFVNDSIKTLDELREFDRDLDHHFDDAFYVNGMIDSCFSLCSMLGLVLPLTVNFIEWRNFFRHEHVISKNQIKGFINELRGLDLVLKRLKEGKVSKFELIAAPSTTVITGEKKFKKLVANLRELAAQHILRFPEFSELALSSVGNAQQLAMVNQRNRGAFFRIGSIFRDLKLLGYFNRYSPSSEEILKINHVIELCNRYAHETNDHVVIKYSEDTSFAMTGENMLSIDEINLFMQSDHRSLLKLLGH